ncbi:thioredoxin-like 1-2 [Carex littledalei]|uniref:Thioredoxin-like 1-2 n=1 Tax=Carex littledalei TaxID=544730 RepID=A0A833VK50_9POAL|nr:thioredoxin-like 1-2 [Carex littledalei]
MAISLRNGSHFSGIKEFARENYFFGPSSIAVGQANELNFRTKRIELKMQIRSTGWELRCNSNDSDHVENRGKGTPCWWEMAHDNYREILCADDLAESLKNAGDKLVVLHFYSPSCCGCRTLHPKVFQIAETHQEAIFLKVNQQVHKSLCDTLMVHVLPFFQFYRGAQGRIHSFSCTLATINKLKDALKKHGIKESDLGPSKGSEEEWIRPPTWLLVLHEGLTLVPFIL